MYTKKVNQLKQKHKDLCNDFVLDNFLFSVSQNIHSKKRQRKKRKMKQTQSKYLIIERVFRIQLLFVHRRRSRDLERCRDDDL